MVSKLFVPLIVLLSFGTMAQPVSPFNHHRSQLDSVADFSFIISGHFHGSSANQSTFPAATILAGIDTLNALQPAFIISLGDMFLDVNQDYISHYQQSFFSKLDPPLYNAVGNHDLSNGGLYTKVYGDTWFDFHAGACSFIILNSELDDGSIKGDQLDFFKAAVGRAIKGRSANVFIFSHRPVWAEENPRYRDLFPGNTRTAIGENNYRSEILPILKQLTGRIFWCSGSLGGGPASFFYDQNKEEGITYIQTAIRDLPRDAVLKADIKGNNVNFTGISLTGKVLQSIDKYDVAFWKNTASPEDSFNFRLLPMLIKQMVLHYYFWCGIAFTIFLMLLFKLFRRWRKRK